MAERIEKRHLTNVIVADFVGPRNRITALGRELGDRFSAALASSSNSFEVLPRNNKSATGGGGFGASSDTIESRAAWVLCRMTGADAVIVGHMKIDSSSIEITLTAWETQKSEMPGTITFPDKLDEFKVQLPVSSEDQALAGQILRTEPEPYFELTAGLKDADVPPPEPKRIRCDISFTVRGKTVLLLGLDAGGHVTEVEVLSAPTDKDGQQAAHAAKKWLFEPARDAKGQPIPGHVTFILSVATHP